MLTRQSQHNVSQVSNLSGHIEVHTNTVWGGSKASHCPHILLSLPLGICCIAGLHFSIRQPLGYGTIKPKGYFEIYTSSKSFHRVSQVSNLSGHIEMFTESVSYFAASQRCTSLFAKHWVTEPLGYGTISPKVYLEIYTSSK